MDDARTAAAKAAPFQSAKTDRRRFQRVRVNLLGRYMLEDKREYPCQVVDMSPGGARLVAPVTGSVGERVVAYIDHIGRIEGRCTRLLDGGFAMSVETTARKRDKLAAQLTWLANRHVLNLPEDRRHDRFVPRTPYTTLVDETGHEQRAKIIDASLSGVAVQVERKPPMGVAVRIGQLRGRVVRRFDEGVAIEFSVVQTPDGLDRNLS